MDVRKTCHNCHESKLRVGNFPSKLVHKPLNPKAKGRVWASYCYDCLKAQPELWKNVEQGYV